MKNIKIIKICNQKLIFLNYSKNTIKIYIHYIMEFVNTFDKQIVHLNSKNFTNYLINYKFTSTSQQNQVISSIKFLYKYVLNKKYDKVSFTRPRKERKLPRIIDKDILKSKILSIENLKHKAILSLAYSCGLRVSEILNLKINCIDSKRMLITIMQSKGRKDRIVPLSQNLLIILRDYFKVYNPVTYLFNGQSSLLYSATSCNKMIKKYLGDDVHMHLLRHSCFTHMLESGAGIRVIQSVAGHKNSKTTEIYTHVSTNIIHQIQMPI